MRYISTRGGAAPASFADILLEGLAPDGGLYMPQAWPQLGPERIAAFAGQPYAQVAAEVIGLFAGDTFTPADLLDDCRAAYATFTHPAVAPLRQLGSGLWLLELFHGPTLAFKDVAMQLLARLYERELTRRGRRLTIVVATSGDTGGAAVEAFRGSDRVDLVVLFPENRISEVQRRFMTTTEDANIRCVAVEGTFDDCQALVKAMFADDGFRGEVDLSGVNSINWARIAAQCVYYVTACAALGREISVVVPTGNFGDAFAAYVAHRLGAPIARIVAATNSNDIVARALQTGRYARGDVVATQSPAMDIQVASNFERLYFEATSRDAGGTAAAFSRFQQTGAIDLPAPARAAMEALFGGAAVDESQTTQTLREHPGELIDPHTATAVCAAHHAGLRGPVVVLSTAHPAKFPEAVLAATGRQPGIHDRARDLHTKVERIDRLPADLAGLKTYVSDFARARRA